MVNCKKRKNMTGTVDNAVEEIKNFFHTLQTSENWFRFGVTFSTQEKYYFLDTGTGKIFRVNQQVYRVLECILKTNNFENLSYLGMTEEELLLALKEIEKAVKEEHILQAPRVTGMVYYKEDIENSLDHAMQAVTLEITERCNLRCDYCIYNENDSDFRQFGSTDISPDTIKTALDFFFARCGKEFNVGFYGGEPLIRFDLIKIAVEYAEKLVDGTNKELHFFFATESPDENAISLQDAVEQLTEEYRDRLEEIEAGTEYNRQEIQSNDGSYAIAWQNVLAVFASQTAGDANGAAVAYLDEDNVERLRTVLWDMNELYWRTESQTREVEQTNEDDESETTTITETVLIIELIHHTPEEMRDAYHFTNRQNEYLTLLSGDETSILWGELLGGFVQGSGEIMAPGMDTVFADGALQWPLPIAGTITSPQGYRTDPVTGEISYHSGTDIAVPEGTPILAAADGTVTIANATDSWGGSYGYYVKIDHGGGLTTLYSHCSSICVTVGRQVLAGQVVAYVGQTGRATGPHLHFEVQQNK